MLKDYNSACRILSQIMTDLDTMALFCPLCLHFSRFCRNKLGFNLSRLIFFFREITEEIMVEYLGNLRQEMDIDILFLEDAINVASVTIQLSGKPVYSASLRHLVKHHPDPFSNFHGFELFMQGVPLPLKKLPIKSVGSDSRYPPHMDCQELSTE